MLLCAMIKGIICMRKLRVDDNKRLWYTIFYANKESRPIRRRIGLRPECCRTPASQAYAMSLAHCGSDFVGRGSTCRHSLREYQHTDAPSFARQGVSPIVVPTSLEGARRAVTCFASNYIRRHGQVVRQRSATPLSPVRIWLAPLKPAYMSAFSVES